VATKEIDEQDRIVRQGTAAWERLKTDKSWSDWLAVGEALRVGRRLSMHWAGTNRPAGKGYAQEFGRWLVTNRLADMDGADRVKLLIVMDNLPAIETWRLSLTDAKRMRLNHPATVLRNWQHDTGAAPDRPNAPRPAPTPRPAHVRPLGRASRPDAPRQPDAVAESQPAIAQQLGVSEADVRVASHILNEAPALPEEARQAERSRPPCTFCGERGEDGRLLIDVGGSGDVFICEQCSDDAAAQFFCLRNPRLQWVEAASDIPGHPQRRDNEDEDESRYWIVPVARRGRFARYTVRDEGREIGRTDTFDEAAALAQRHADLEALAPEETLDRWVVYRD
jgi:hypothetical protein